MMKQIVRVFVLCALSITLLSACGNQTDVQNAGESRNSSLVEMDVQRELERDAVKSEETLEDDLTTESEPADGYEILGGTWEVGGLYIKNKLIDVHDNAAMEDLYDSTFISFNEDGTFLYYNLFFHSGNYMNCSQAGAESNTFLLKTDSVDRYVLENNKLVEKECTSDTTPYIVTVIAGDENTLLFSEYDPITGKSKADDEPLVFVKEEKESLYIPEYKTPLPSNSAQATTPKIDDTQIEKASIGEKNALQKAKDYLSFMAFSHDGLVEQLEYEGFSYSEAVYGADHCGADWMKQAVKKAKEYLDFMSFSRDGLIEQLEYEGFTHEQAVYGAEQNGF